MECVQHVLQKQINKIDIMLSPRLTNCPECPDISSLLKKIDCKLAELGNNLYNNISYMLNKPVPADDITQLIGYRRILLYKLCNPSYVEKYSVAMISSKVIRLTVGCVSRCNTPEPCIEERCDITVIPNTTSTTSTSSTSTTTSTSTTIVPTTTTTSSSTSTSTSTSTSSSSTTTTSSSSSSTTTTTTSVPTTTTTTTIAVECKDFILEATGPTGSPGDVDWSALDCYTSEPVGGTIIYPDAIRTGCVIASSLVYGIKIINTNTLSCITTTTTTTTI